MCVCVCVWISVYKLYIPICIQYNCMRYCPLSGYRSTHNHIKASIVWALWVKCLLMVPTKKSVSSCFLKYRIWISLATTRLELFSYFHLTLYAFSFVLSSTWYLGFVINLYPASHCECFHPLTLERLGDSLPIVGMILGHFIDFCPLDSFPCDSYPAIVWIKFRRACVVFFQWTNILQ